MIDMLYKRNFCKSCGKEYEFILADNKPRDFVCFICRFPPYGCKYIVPDMSDSITRNNVNNFCQQILND